MSRLLTLFLYLLLFVIALGIAAYGARNYLTLTRGIENDFPVTRKIIGTNVALEQYATEAELERALDALKNARVHVARQYFSWREIETVRGVYEWEKWDRLVNAARAKEIELVAVLTTAPAWSQRAHERDMPNAPPDDFADYARFVGALAQRYGDSIRFYQIWDEPNVEPNWGKRNADPVEYAQLLIPAAKAIRAHDADAVIVLAGLAMNLELHRPHPNYSEILFLRGLYEIGAHEAFDIVAAKPYGMWSGPEDRTVNSGVLNFSRVILLRDEMRLYGDARKPMWAVEMGWNALPEKWNGGPSPWGTDTEEKQADRLLRALARVENEWAWMTGEFPLYLQPNVTHENPRWGFALFTSDFEPRVFYETLKQFTSVPARSVPPPSLPLLPLALLLGAALVAAWRAWVWMGALRVEEHWTRLKTRTHAFPELAQVGLVVIVAAAFYFSPNVILNFVLLGALIVLFALRLDFGIALTIFAIPFWNYPKTVLGGFDLSPVEAFTWLVTAAFLVNAILNRNVSRRTFKSLAPSIQSLDYAVLAFLLLALVSTRWAGNFGVASREFRIIVLDPILLYAILRFSAFDLKQTRWFVDALLASGVAVCVIGFYKFATGDVILADGVARLMSVWGSPNNVGLYLGRLLPIALAFALMLRGIRMRWMYAGMVALFAVTIVLTYSRGALFFGVPASVLFILLMLYFQAHHLSRRAWFVIGAAAMLVSIALIPFLLSERFTSLFQTGTGTGFFRVALWTSAVNMIRDHPLLGVGLDNFLYEYPKYILPEAWREPNLSHPHNFVLDFWVRLGIGGLAIFVWMLVAFFKRAWKNFMWWVATEPGSVATHLYPRALMLGLMASMVNLLAHGLMDASFFVIDLAYVFMLTLALAAVRIETEPGSVSIRAE